MRSEIIIIFVRLVIQMCSTIISGIYRAPKLVDIDFYDKDLPKSIGNSKDIKGHFYFRSAYRNEPDFWIETMQRQQNPTEAIRLESLIQNDQTVSTNY